MRSIGRRFVPVGAAALLVVLAGGALFVGLRDGGGEEAAASPTAQIATGSPTASAGFASPPAGPTATATEAPTPTPAVSTFQPLDVFAMPTAPPPKGALPTDQVDSPAPRRPVPAQSPEWLGLKAAGRIALVDGKPVVLDAGADPLVNPATGAPVPAARTLDTAYARWIIEPLGYGKDAKGNNFSDRNLWNLCEPGATTAALYYWQQLTGHPNVTGTAGYFLDPYAAEGVAWPAPGPTVARSSGGARIGTYWSGSDRLNGYTAHARGYIMYLGMVVQPPGWQSQGIAVYADASGRPLYPTIGAPRTNIQVALNWEASGHEAQGWAEFWYASVMRFEPTAARDLQIAVTLDVGRDSVPVVVELDTHDLPNWQAGSKTPHIRHAVTIVGYDNAAKPPTFTYIDTCGRGCNSRAGNTNGQLHVVAQSQMLVAMQDSVGSGFVW
ncbi:MAG: hypothetical protein ABSD62_00710 [Candidatus Limnocylindrales bacterium]|jgi:hypothetical protein